MTVIHHQKIFIRPVGTGRGGGVGVFLVPGFW